MPRSRRASSVSLLVTLFCLAFAGVPGPAAAGGPPPPAAPAAGYGPKQPVPAPSAEAMVLDALIVRPLSLGATALGAGVFIVSLPFTALGGNVHQAGERLVAEPAKYTFARPLGDFRR